MKYSSELNRSMEFLSKNSKTIPLNPIKTPRDFGRDSFSSFKKKCAKRDPLKGVVLIKIAAK